MKRIVVTPEHLTECEEKFDPQKKFIYPSLSLAVESKCLATCSLPLRPGNKIFVLIDRRWFAIGSLGYCKKLKELVKSPLYFTLCKIAASVGLNKLADIAVKDKSLKPNKLHYWARHSLNRVPFGAVLSIENPTFELFKKIFNSPTTCWLIPFHPTSESQFSPTPNTNVFLIRPSIQRPDESIPVHLVKHNVLEKKEIDPDHFGWVLERITDINKRKCRLSTTYAIWKDPESSSYCFISEWLKQETNIYSHPLIVINGFDCIVQLVMIGKLAVPTLDWSHFAFSKHQGEIMLNLGCLSLDQYVEATPESIEKMFESFVQSICSVSSINYNIYNQVWKIHVIGELRTLLENNRIFEASVLCMSSLKMMSWIRILGKD